MNDYVVSLIRTWVPVGVGFALTWLATELGVVLDENSGAMAVAVAVSLVTAVWYAAARAVERAFPALGSVLVGLGIGGGPQYVKQASGQTRLPRV